MKSLESRIRTELRNYPSDRVDQFLDHVQLMYRLTRGVKLPGKAERLKTLKRLYKAAGAFLKATGAAMGQLNEVGPLGEAFGPIARAIVQAGGVDEYFARPLRVDAAPTGPDELSEAWRGALWRVSHLAQALSQEIEQLERSERRGTRLADANGVLAEIARFYRDTLGETPTTTMGGPFYNVAALLLRQQNVERPVRAAVAALLTK